MLYFYGYALNAQHSRMIFHIIIFFALSGSLKAPDRILLIL